MAWASAKFAFMSDVALGLMGADLKRRESVSGRFADVLSQMYLMTATLKRFQEEGERKEDELLLKVAMSEGFSKIDEAFAGIYENLASGVLSLPFKLMGFCSKINPLGTRTKDDDLHTIAHAVGSDEVLRNRLCSNIYKGGRVAELSMATFAMQEAQEVWVKVKKEGLTSLTPEEQERYEKAKRWQEKIVEVDSFTKDEYFARSR